MLILRRKEGQWIEVTHRSGDVLRFRVYDIGTPCSRTANLAFDDPAMNFSIQRPERVAGGVAARTPRPAPSPASAGS